MEAGAQDGQRLAGCLTDASNIAAIKGEEAANFVSITHRNLTPKHNYREFHTSPPSLLSPSHLLASSLYRTPRMSPRIKLKARRSPALNDHTHTHTKPIAVMRLRLLQLQLQTSPLPNPSNSKFVSPSVQIQILYSIIMTSASLNSQVIARFPSPARNFGLRPTHMGLRPMIPRRTTSVLGQSNNRLLTFWI